MGGRGGVINTLLGALVMGIIANIMNLAGVPGYHQQVFIWASSSSSPCSSNMQRVPQPLTPSSPRPHPFHRRRQGQPVRAPWSTAAAGSSPSPAASTTRSCRPSAGGAAAERLVGRRRPRHPRDAGRGGGRPRAHRRDLRLRPDARHGAGRRGGPADPQQRALWNDKRTAGIVAAFEAANRRRATSPRAATRRRRPGPASSSPWLRDHDPEAYAAAAAVIMPKDFINLKLTGEIAMDPGDASCKLPDEPALARLVAGDDRPARPRRRQAAADPRAA